MKFWILIMSAYLLGSIPFGLIIASVHGKDLRRTGSGNIGATNLSRLLGRKWAYLCFCLDVLKGLVPMLAARTLVAVEVGTVELLQWLAVGCAAVVGHIFPIYVKFKGGKGVATSFGVALGLWPYYTICAAFAFATWVIVVLVTGYVSLASISASVVFPVVLAAATGLVAGWNFTDLWPLEAAAIVIPLTVIIRHKENIKRLLGGYEDKIKGRQSRPRRK